MILLRFGPEDSMTRFVVGDEQCRRVATRYDKLAASYPAFIKLASIRIWLRANESGSL
jgi:transposase